MYIAVASLAQNKLEELFLAAVVWATLVIIAVIVAPSEKGAINRCLIFIQIYLYSFVMSKTEFVLRCTIGRVHQGKGLKGWQHPFENFIGIEPECTLPIVDGTDSKVWIRFSGATERQTA